VVVTNEKVNKHIPNDLSFFVLSKLSVKFIKRFGCVCKSWAILFENSHFMNIHRNNFITNSISYCDDTFLLLR
jgi:molecular chaperone HtpG